MAHNIFECLKNSILVVDGAMGTQIQGFNLTEDDYKGATFAHIKTKLKGNHDILTLTRPDIIQNIHRKYLQAGADIIETNTFNSTGISQADYNTEAYVYQMNKAAAMLAGEVARQYSLSDKPRFVAGSIGPTNKTLSISQNVENPAFRAVSFDEMRIAYKEQIIGLIDGGVDILLIETIFDTLVARAALVAAEEVFEEKNIKVPIMISGTLTDKSGRTLSGQTLEAFTASMTNDNIISVGINCSFGAKQLIPFIRQLSKTQNKYVSVYPNAGLPNRFGQYDETPDVTVSFIKELVDDGCLNIVGGCCGTTPAHIKAISELVKDRKPRLIPQIIAETYFCGLELLKVSKETNFINIGERNNVAGSKKFARLIQEKNYSEALSIAREQVENGAQILDINFDDAMLDSKAEMDTFLKLIAGEPEISKAPIMIDSSKWEVIEAGLKAIQGKPIVNSISLKNGEDEFLEKALIVKRYGAAVVVMAFDEKGQADTFERKIEICKRSYELLTKKAMFLPQDIIFDTNILAIGTGVAEHDNYAVNFINAVKWIKENLPFAKTSGGLSNLSFSFRGNQDIREIIHSVFLYHAILAGLDMAILNPGMIQIYDTIDKKALELVENLVLNKTQDATEKLVEFAQSFSQDFKDTQKVDKNLWRNESLKERLSYALIKGIDQYLEQDICEAMQEEKASIAVIEGPLMDGMKKVGELFGQGKMFLPQVIKSARIMKRAVEHLTPYIEQEKLLGATKSVGRVLLATVKGDVHDIGKNIVKVVLECNNFEIIDLGVMVSAEDIIDTAKREKVDLIGLSGLITPSLDEMCYVAELMQNEGLCIPLMIGGATTSMLHTAIKIEPHYKGKVIYVSDASKSVEVCTKLMNANTRSAFLEKKQMEYELMRKSYFEHERKIYSLKTARENKIQIDWKMESIVSPKALGINVIDSMDISSIYQYIDWTYFFTAWDMNMKYPEILTDAKYGEYANKLFDEANLLLDKVAKDKSLAIKAVFGIFAANSTGDDIELYEDDLRSVVATTLHFLRQQEKKDSNYLCMADFVAPKETGIKDYIGAFAITAGIGLKELVHNHKSRKDEYSGIMISLLADRLAEAYSEYLHEKVADEYWGYTSIGGNEGRGVRPAIGYPSIPDHTEKEQIFTLLNVKNKIGITLTDSYMMQPVSSVCGLYIGSRFGRYFDIGKIDEEQLTDYMARKKWTKSEALKWIGNKLK